MRALDVKFGIVLQVLLFGVRAFRTRPSLGDVDYLHSKHPAAPSSSSLLPNAAGLEANQYIQAIHNPIFRARDRNTIAKALRAGPYYGPLHCSSLGTSNRTKYGEGFWLKLDGHLDTPLLCVKVTCPKSGKSEDIGYEFMEDCGPAAALLEEKTSQVEGLRLLESHLLFQPRKGNGFHYMWSPFGRHREPKPKDQGIVDFDFLTEHPHGYSQPHCGVDGRLFAHVPTSRAWAIIDEKTCASLKDDNLPDVSTNHLYEQCVSQKSREKAQCQAKVRTKMKGGWKWYKKQRELPQREMFVHSCEQYLKTHWMDYVLGISGWDECKNDLASQLRTLFQNCGYFGKECEYGLTKLQCMAEVPLPVPSERRSRI